MVCGICGSRQKNFDRRSRFSGTHYHEDMERVSKVEPSTTFLGRLGRIASHHGSVASDETIESDRSRSSTYRRSVAWFTRKYGRTIGKLKPTPPPRPRLFGSNEQEKATDGVTKDERTDTQTSL